MIVDNTQVTLRQTRTKIYIVKPTTLSPLLKIKKETKKSYKSKISILTKDNFFSKDHTITTQKQTKTTLLTRKLHSSHPFT